MSLSTVQIVSPVSSLFVNLGENVNSREEQ